MLFGSVQAHMLYTDIISSAATFVAVGLSNTGYYSMDGINWSSMTLPSNNAWRTVTSENNKFIAAADGTYGAYSSNGISWSASTLPVSDTWFSSTYGNGKFVILGASGNILYSTDDGITWSTSLLPVNGSGLLWRSITYGNGRFVAVGSATTGPTNLFAYSSDGISWTMATVSLTLSDWSAVAYGNGIFVATSGNFNGSTIGAYSSDGISWSGSTLPYALDWNALAYGNGVFVSTGGSSIAGVGGNTPYGAYGAGTSWTPRTIGPALWNSCTYSANKSRFVLIGHNAPSTTTQYCIYSSDGISWAAATIPQGFILLDVAARI